MGKSDLSDWSRLFQELGFSARYVYKGTFSSTGVIQPCACWPPLSMMERNDAIATKLLFGKTATFTFIAVDSVRCSALIVE